MTSSISNFKKFLTTYSKSLKSLFIVTLLAAIIELTIFYKLYDKNLYKKIYAENLLELKFMKEDKDASQIIGLKNYALYGKKADIVEIGESTGLYGVDAVTINQHLNELTLVNASFVGDSTWQIYTSVAEHYLQQTHAKYLMIYLSPYKPQAFAANKSSNKTNVAGLGTKLTDLYSSPWRFFYQFPSIFFRKEIADFAYYREEKTKTRYLDVLKKTIQNYQPNSEQSSADFLSENLGWVPLSRDLRNKKFFDKMPRGACDSNINESMLHSKRQDMEFADFLIEIRALAKKFNAKLMIVFNPVPCTISQQIMPFVEEVELFKKNNPDIYMPFEVIRTYDEKYFVDQWHLTPEGANKNSHELGKELARFFSKN
jgi:hypothetical protein